MGVPSAVKRRPVDRHHVPPAVQFASAFGRAGRCHLARPSRYGLGGGGWLPAIVLIVLSLSRDEADDPK
jgi:hypothetical protein